MPGTYIYLKPAELICSCNLTLGPDWPSLPTSVIHTSFFLSRSLLVPLSISHFLPFRGYPFAILLLSYLCLFSVFHSPFLPFPSSISFRCLQFLSSLIISVLRNDFMYIVQRGRVYEEVTKLSINQELVPGGCNPPGTKSSGV